MQRPMEKHENYLAGGVFAVILPPGDLSSVILALGGIIIVLVAFLLILRAYKSKKSSDKFQKRFSGIKRQFNDLKEEEMVQEDDDWLKMKREEDPNEIQNQLGMNKK